MAICSIPLLSCVLLLQPTTANHDLSWDIASDLSGQRTPNLLSELIYEDIKSTGVGLGLELTQRLHRYSPWSLSAEGVLQFSAMDDGRYSDDDYDGNDRTELFSRSVGQVSGSNYKHFSAQLGLHRRFDAGHRLGILLGLHRNELDLLMTDGEQIFSTKGTTTADLAGLRSRYDSVWESASVGIEYRYQQPVFGELFVRYAYHQGLYTATADWNLRTDFAHPVSFIHQADSQGNTLRFGYRSAADSSFGWRLEYEWNSFETDPGFDRTFFSDGSFGDTRLNRARWDNNSLLLGLEWRL